MAENTGHTPRAVIVLGGQAIIAKDFEIQATKNAEADTATTNLDLEYVDTSVFVKKGQILIEIWAGYIDERYSNTSISALLKNKQYEKFLFKRFEGILDQPEFTIGNEHNLKLNCRDYISVLMDAKFTTERKGSQATAKNLVSFIQSKTKGSTITIDPDANFVMGKQDKRTKEYVYNIIGKSYWQVLLDIARQGGLNIRKNGKTILLTKGTSTKNVWPMVKTRSKDEKLPWNNFDKVTIRFGDNYKAGKDDVFVEVFGMSTPKKSNRTTGATPGRKKKVSSIHPIIGKYPKNAKDFENAENVQYISRRVGSTTQQQADTLAEQIAKEYLRTFVTGDLSLPFANPELKADDGIKFDIDPNHPQYKTFYPLFHKIDENGKFQGQRIFRIESFTERFSLNGYSQDIEFETSSYEELKPGQSLYKTTTGSFYYNDGKAFGELSAFAVDNKIG